MPFAQTTGRVLDKRIEEYKDDEGGTFYRPFVLYEYTVNGMRYTCDQVTSWRISTITKDFANRVLERYEYGMQVTVTYNTENPEKAYLEKGAGSAFAISPAGIGCLLLVTVIIIVVFLFTEQGQILSNSVIQNILQHLNQ